MENQKKKFQVFKVTDYYNSYGMLTHQDKVSLGVTFAKSVRQAINNIRFRTGVRCRDYYGPGDGGAIENLVAVEVC